MNRVVKSLLLLNYSYDFNICVPAKEAGINEKPERCNYLEILLFSSIAALVDQKKRTPSAWEKQ